MTNDDDVALSDGCQWAVSIVFQSGRGLETSLHSRLTILSAESEGAAIGAALKQFRDGDLPDPAASLIELALPVSPLTTQDKAD
jgi:hypothetical protein